MSKVLRTILAATAIAGLASFVFIYTGAYNVAADAPHGALTVRLLRTLQDRSIRSRAREIQVPKLGDAERVAVGAQHYEAMCAGCHLAPGMPESELRDGLYPEPPNLAETSGANPAEAFWVIKHGIKLTAMPAWGATHDDPTIWSIVAFLQRLPTLSVEEYRALTAGDSEDEDHGHRHDSHAEHSSHHAGDTTSHEESGGHVHAGEHHHE